MLLLSAVLVVAVVLPVRDPGVEDDVRRAVCAMFNLEDEECDEIAPPGETPGEPADPFELERLQLPCIADRTRLGGEAMVLIPIPDSPVGVRLEVAVGVVIDQVGTGLWRVTFHVDPGAGIGHLSGPYIGEGSGRAGAYRDLSYTQGFRSSVSYDFHSYDEAWDFATDVRQWVRARPEAAQMVVDEAGSWFGSPGRLIAGVANAVVGVITEAGNAVLDKVLGTPAEPDVSITNAHGYLRGRAETGYYAGARGGAGAGVELEGEMFLSEFHREGPAEGWTFFTFEASADGHIDLFTRLAGRSPVSAAGGVGLGGGVVFRSRVIWDADGKPVRWTLIEEVRSGWQFLLGQGNSNAPGRPGDFVEGSFRDVTITEYNLDLTDEENLEAFNDAFWTVPGQFAYPRIPPNIDPLVERLEGDAVQVGLEYRERTVDAAGLGVGSGAAAFRGDVMVVHRELQSATYLDHQWENPTPAVFTSCYSERDIFGPPAGDTGI